RHFGRGGKIARCTRDHSGDACSDSAGGGGTQRIGRPAGRQSGQSPACFRTRGGPPGNRAPAVATGRSSHVGGRRGGPVRVDGAAGHPLRNLGGTRSGAGGRGSVAARPGQCTVATRGGTRGRGRQFRAGDDGQGRHGGARTGTRDTWGNPVRVDAGKSP